MCPLNRARSALAIVPLLALFLAISAQAQEMEMSFSATGTSTIYEERPMENGGGFSQFCIGNLMNPGMTRRALLQFDLSTLPAGATITQVVLQVRQVRVRDQGPGAPKAATLRAHRVNDAWTEGTGGGGSGPGNSACGGASVATGVTWNTQPAVLANASGTAAMPIGSSVSVSIDSDTAGNEGMVSDVQDWLDGNADNRGWMLQLAEESSADNARLVGNAQLTVFYTEGSGPVLEINAGMNDAWFNIATQGQGFFVTVFPDTGLIFVAWFTFDTFLPDGMTSANVGYIGHRWLTAIGTWEGNKATLTFELTEDGLFDDPTMVNQTQGYGTLMIEFHDCSSATATYDIPSAGVMGSIPLGRAVADNVALCNALGFE